MGSGGGEHGARRLERRGKRESRRTCHDDCRPRTELVHGCEDRWRLGGPGPGAGGLANPACQSAESLLEPLGMATKDAFEIVLALANINADGAGASAFVKSNTHDFGNRTPARERDLTGGGEDARCFGRLPTTVLVFLQAKGASQLVGEGSKLSFGGTSTELMGKQRFVASVLFLA